MVHMQSMLNHAQQSLEESLREHKAASDALSIVSAERYACFFDSMTELQIMSLLISVFLFSLHSDAYLMLLERNAVDGMVSQAVAMLACLCAWHTRAASCCACSAIWRNGCFQAQSCV